MKLDFNVEQKKLKLALAGDYRDFDDEEAKSRLLGAVRGGSVREAVINAGNIGSWDSTLVVVLYELIRECRRADVPVSYEDFPPNLRRLVELAFMVDRKPSLPQNSQAERPRRRFCGRCGSSLDGQTGRCPVCDGEGNTKEIEAEELYVEEGLEHMDFTLRTGTESRTVTAAGNISTAADAGAAANAGVAQSLAGKLSRKICPSCGLIFSGDKTTCPVCGSGLEDRK